MRFIRRAQLTAVEATFVRLVCAGFIVITGCVLASRSMSGPVELKAVLVFVGAGSWVTLPIVAFRVLLKNRPLERFPRIVGLPFFLMWVMAFAPPYHARYLLDGFLFLGLAVGIWYAPEIYRYILWKGGRW